MEYITNEEYRKREGVSSSVLKKLLVSEAHLNYVLMNGWPKTDSTILGDAFHAWFLEFKRFAESYSEEVEVYKRATGDKKAGDAKLDENGNPLTILRHLNDSSMDIKGEQYKKFKSMVQAVEECDEAKDIFKNKFNVEQSFFSDVDGQKVKARCDCMYKDKDGHVWIVDLKTVGGTKEKPSAPEKFAQVMFDLGYDLQAYMYTEIIKQEIPEVYGFKFLCVDAKCPSGVKIYDIVPGQSKWYELGGYRFHDALDKYKVFNQNVIHPVYEEATGDELELSFSAADALTMYQNGGI